MEEKISEKIRQRLEEKGIRYFSSDNISDHITDKEYKELLKEVENSVQDLLKSLVIDTENDHNTQETARRVAKMFLQETFSGRYVQPPVATSFPNASEYDELYVTGPISIRSTCAHHFAPIIGKAWIGVQPGSKVIGLSKFNRLVNWVCSRPQIQEEMTIQIADELQEATEARGVAVVVQAEHMCMTLRGVKEHESNMTTSIMRGDFRDQPHLKQEFFDLIRKK